MSRTLWYAEGFRWIATLLLRAAWRLERNAALAPAPDPRSLREAREYLDGVRTRAHLQV